VEDRNHVGGAHCCNLQVGSQSDSYHPCKTHVLISIPKHLSEFKNIIPALKDAEDATSSEKPGDRENAFLHCGGDLDAEDSSRKQSKIPGLHICHCWFVNSMSHVWERHCDWSLSKAHCAGNAEQRTRDSAY